MKPDEIRKLEAYLNRTFKTAGIQVKPMPRKKDTAEIYVGEDFIGTVGKDTDEGETSYHVTITVLDIDLD